MAELAITKTKGIDNHQFYEFLNKEIEWVPKKKTHPVLLDEAVLEYQSDKHNSIARQLTYFVIDNDFKSINNITLQKFKEKNKKDNLPFENLDSKINTNISKIVEDVKIGQTKLSQTKSKKLLSYRNVACLASARSRLAVTIRNC